MRIEIKLADKEVVKEKNGLILGNPGIDIEIPEEYMKMVDYLPINDLISGKFDTEILPNGLIGDVVEIRKDHIVVDVLDEYLEIDEYLEHKKAEPIIESLKSGECLACALYTKGDNAMVIHRFVATPRDYINKAGR